MSSTKNTMKVSPKGLNSFNLVTNAHIDARAESSHLCQSLSQRLLEEIYTCLIWKTLLLKTGVRVCPTLYPVKIFGALWNVMCDKTDHELQNYNICFPLGITWFTKLSVGFTSLCSWLLFYFCFIFYVFIYFFQQKI